METNPLLSIIIISYNTANITLDCLKSIVLDKGLKDIPHEIIVIDNASTDGSVAKIKSKYPSIKLIKNTTNHGFSGGNNQGIKIARGNYILLLNSDTIILHSAISQSLDWLSSHPEAGICTAQLLNPDKSIQISGGYFPNLANVLTWATGLDDLPFVNSIIKPFHPHPPQFYTGDRFYLQDRRLDWLTGAYLLFRAELLRKVDGFDENYFMYGEEYELQYRIHKKFSQSQFWYLIGPQIIHLGGASSIDRNFPLVKEYHGIIAFFTKHRPPWQSKLVKIILKLSPTLYLRAIFFAITGNPARAKFYLDTCSKI